MQPYLDKYLAGHLQNPSESHTQEASKKREDDAPTNTDNWRSIALPNKNGIVLGSLDFDDLKNLEEDLKEINDTGAFYDMVCRGIHDWNDAHKNWRKVNTVNKNTKEESVLGSWTLQEMEDMLEKILERMPHHPLRQPIACGIEQLKEAEAKVKKAQLPDTDPDFDEDDDIPF